VGVAGPEELSVTEASRRGVARLVADAAHGSEVVVLRHHVPVAAVVGIERLRELESLRADLRDLALVVGRVADDDGRRTGLDEVQAAYVGARRAVEG
jgi:antitoxin (DNA-binding transcriptional repressor) of toxin-antitoxin stability system